jgi:MFS family permease
LTGTKRFFYGWILVGAACICYGFGLSPAYYSWGVFAPNITEDLGLSRWEIGIIFGVFVWIFSAIGPLVGMAQSRWGIRRVMTVGACTAALGFALMSRANSVLSCLLTFSVLGGIGIGLSGIIPCQTLAAHWFVRYRARATAIIFATGGLVGKLVPKIDSWVLGFSTWRTGWLVVAGISAAVAVVAATFIRNSPEELGQRPDGDPPDSAAGTASDDPADDVGERDPKWTVAQAIRTPQFLVLIACGLASGPAWGVIVAHGPLHMEEIGFTPAFARNLIGTLALMSVAGRFSASLADLVSPQRFLALGLATEALGTAGFLIARSPAVAYAAAILMGLGFGASYIALAIATSSFFGLPAFGTVVGIRFLIGGTFAAVAPGLAGLTYDRLGSYHPAFLVLVIVGLVGAVLAALCPRPAPATAQVSGE